MVSCQGASYSFVDVTHDDSRPDPALNSQSASADPAAVGEQPSRSWTRARRPEQKQARREAIVAAAVGLLDEHGLDGTTLSAIARASGISKANIYRYFESREAILLEVTLGAGQAWLDDSVRALAALAGRGDIEAVADALATTTVAHSRLCMLIASLSSVLEHNVGVEVIADFKIRFTGMVGGLIQAVHQALPTISLDDSRTFVTYFYLFVAGAWPAAHPPPLVVQVLARPEFAQMCIDFETAVRGQAEILLRGFAAAR